jgi:hypothetical protein
MAEWLAAGRPVLVSNRGGLGEAAGAYPGSVSIEPTVESIVASIADSIEATRWPELVAAVRSNERRQDVEGWAASQREIYRQARRQFGARRRGTSLREA